MKRRRFYAWPANVLMLAASLLLAVAQADSSERHELSPLNAIKMQDALPFREERKDEAKPEMLSPDALVLRQVKQEHVEQHFALGNNGPTLARFAVSQEHGVNPLSGTSPPLSSFQGAVLAGNILDLRPAQIALSAVYLEGRRDLALTPEVALSHDRAWSVGADARIFSDQLHLYGEYAWTRHNSDPFAATPAEDDSAYKLQWSYQPPQTFSFLDVPLNWSMGMKYKRVGGLFQSPAETVEKQGISRWESFTHLDWQGLELDASTTQESERPASLPFQPPQQTYRTQLQGRYQFALNLPAWLGLPRVGMKLSRENTEGAKHSSSKAEFEAGFYYQDWNWNLSRSLNWKEADYLAVSAAEAHFKMLSLFSNSVNLAPVLRYQYHGPDLGANGQLSLGLNSRAVFVPERFEGQLQVDVKQGWDKEKLKLAYGTSGDLNWRLTRRKAQAPALRLFLKGRYQAIADQVSRVGFTMDYQVLLGIALD